LLRDLQRVVDLNPEVSDRALELGMPEQPLAHRKATRTTNLLERLFGEERRRSKVIPHAFGERAVMKLKFAALLRASESWRGILITEFEL